MASSTKLLVTRKHDVFAASVQRCRWHAAAKFTESTKHQGWDWLLRRKWRDLNHYHHENKWEQYARGCDGDHVTDMIANHLEWVLNGLVGSICRIATQILGRKSFLNQSKQPDRRRHHKQQASRQLPSVTGWIWKISPVWWAEFILKNQLQQNGDLAGLDFVVNRIAYSVISRFYSSPESSCGYIIASWLACPTYAYLAYLLLPLAYLLFL